MTQNMTALKDIRNRISTVKNTAALRSLLADAWQKKLQPTWKSLPIKGDQFDWEIGWWYGSFISDGWADEKYVGYAKLNSCQRAAFVDIARRKISDKFSANEYHEDGSDPQKLGRSSKVHLNGRALAGSVLCCWREPRADAVSERKALRKCIPPELLQTGSRDCLLGLLAGLLEGDGTLTWNTAAKNERAAIRFSTSSPYLVDDIRQLGRLLGIRVSSTTIPPRGMSNTAYAVTFSIPDMWMLGDQLRFITDEATAFWRRFTSLDMPRDNRDIVPVTMQESMQLKKFYSNGSKNYNSALEAGRKGYLTRGIARRMMDGADPELCPVLRATLELEDIRWTCNK